MIESFKKLQHTTYYLENYEKTIIIKGMRLPSINMTGKAK